MEIVKEKIKRLAKGIFILIPIIFIWLFFSVIGDLATNIADSLQDYIDKETKI